LLGEWLTTDATTIEEINLQIRMIDIYICGEGFKRKTNCFLRACFN